MKKSAADAIKRTKQKLLEAASKELDSAWDTVKAVYVCQYGTIWKLQPSTWEKIVKNVVDGDGEYDLNADGQMIMNPGKVKALYREVDSWCSKDKAYPLFNPLDWEKDDWKWMLERIGSKKLSEMARAPKAEMTIGQWLDSDACIDLDVYDDVSPTVYFAGDGESDTEKLKIKKLAYYDVDQDWSWQFGGYVIEISPSSIGMPIGSGGKVSKNKLLYAFFMFSGRMWHDQGERFFATLADAKKYLKNAKQKSENKENREADRDGHGW